MSVSLENIMLLAERDMAAGRYADAEAEYAKILEADADHYMALHGRGVARTWQSTLLQGDPTALISSTDEALRMCDRLGGNRDAFMARIAIDLINLTSTKYNELTRIYHAIARKENQKAPSPLFFCTWSLAHPQGLSLSDVYIPMINYLAAIIAVSEYLDGLLREYAHLQNRRLHNIGNLNIFYDWLIAFNATGRVTPEYYAEVVKKKEALTPLRDNLESHLETPEYRNVPSVPPEGRPLPGVASEVDKVKKIAVYGVRPPIEVICPVCGTIQKSNRSLCYQCSCQFIFKDEILD